MGAFACILPISMSMVSSNISGSAKKTTVSAMLFLSYCIGNIISPQVFLTREEPKYPVSKINPSYELWLLIRGHYRLVSRFVLLVSLLGLLVPLAFGFICNTVIPLRRLATNQRAAKLLISMRSGLTEKSRVLSICFRKSSTEVLRFVFW
jgi:hypothetical protein